MAKLQVKSATQPVLDFILVKNDYVLCYATEFLGLFITPA